MYVSIYKYLGVLFTSGESVEQEIDNKHLSSSVNNLFVTVTEEQSMKAKLSIYWLMYGHKLWIVI